MSAFFSLPFLWKKKRETKEIVLWFYYYLLPKNSFCLLSLLFTRLGVPRHEPAEFRGFAREKLGKRTGKRTNKVTKVLFAYFLRFSSRKEKLGKRTENNMAILFVFKVFWVLFYKKAREKARSINNTAAEDNITVVNYNALTAANSSLRLIENNM